MSDHDLVLVGGGLQNGLIALATLAARPEARIVILERGPALGGNHTWSFHLETVSLPRAEWFEPLIEHRWERYTVRFPGFERTLPHAYGTCSSAHFAKVVTDACARAPHATIRLDTEVIALDGKGVCLASGEQLTGRLVVDARGPSETPRDHSGWQKFVGLEVELDTPVPDPTTALLMDGHLPQLGAFRFVYLLPFTPTRALVEDTYFANDPTLDAAAVRGRVIEWLTQQRLTVRAVLREEHGVLPMPWRAAEPISRAAPLVAGYRGGWFHPATGYSVPIALRLAVHVAAREPDRVFDRAFDALADEQTRQARFGHLLNELLFTATEPEQRWKVFRHFYELPDDLTLRFYALTLTGADKRRMFLRRPPPGVSFLKAMRVFPRWGMSR